MSEPTNIYAKDLGIDININPIKNSKLYKSPISVKNRSTGKQEFTNAQEDIELCILHDGDGIGTYDSESETYIPEYTNGISIKISKKNSAFDFAKKFNEYLINSKYKNNIRFNNFIEDATADAGKLIFERIQNLADNITNVDTCKWRYLESTYKMYNIDIKNIVSEQYPEELDFLLNIFSLPREYILNNFYDTSITDKDLNYVAQSQNKNILKLLQEKYYNNFYEMIVYPAIKSQLYKNKHIESVKNYIDLTTSSIFNELLNLTLSDYEEFYYPSFRILLSQDSQNLIYSYYQSIKYTMIDKVPGFNQSVLTYDSPEVNNDGTNYLQKFLKTLSWNPEERELFKVFINTYLPPNKLVELQKIETCARHITNMCSKLFVLRKSIKDILIKDSMVGTGLLMEQMIYEFILEQFTQKIGITNQYKLGPKSINNVHKEENEQLSTVFNKLYNLDPISSTNNTEEARIAKLLGVEYDDKFSTLKQLASVLNASIIEYKDTTANYLNIIPTEPVTYKDVNYRSIITYPRYLNSDSVIVYYDYNNPDLSYAFNSDNNVIPPNPRWAFNTTSRERGNIYYDDKNGEHILERFDSETRAPYYSNKDNPYYGMYTLGSGNFIQWQDIKDKPDYMSLIEIDNIKYNGSITGINNTYNRDLKLFYNISENNVTLNRESNWRNEIIVKNSIEDTVETGVPLLNIITCTGEQYFNTISKYNELIPTKRITKIINSHSDEIIKYNDSLVSDGSNTYILRDKSVGTDWKYIKFAINPNIEDNSGNIPNYYIAYNMDNYKIINNSESNQNEYISSDCLVSNYIIPVNNLTYNNDVTIGKPYIDGDDTSTSKNILWLTPINNGEKIIIEYEERDDGVYETVYTYEQVTNESLYTPLIQNSDGYMQKYSSEYKDEEYISLKNATYIGTSPQLYTKIATDNYVNCDNLVSGVTIYVPKMYTESYKTGENATNGVNGVVTYSDANGIKKLLKESSWIQKALKNKNLEYLCGPSDQDPNGIDMFSSKEEAYKSLNYVLSELSDDNYKIYVGTAPTTISAVTGEDGKPIPAHLSGTTFNDLTTYIAISDNSYVGSYLYDNVNNNYVRLSWQTIYRQNSKTKDSPTSGGKYIVYFIKYEYNGTIIDNLTLTINDSPITFTTGIVYRETSDQFKAFGSLINSNGGTFNITYSIPYLVNYTFYSKNNPNIIYMQYNNVGPNGEVFDDSYKTEFHFPNGYICDSIYKLPDDIADNKEELKSNEDIIYCLKNNVFKPEEISYLITKKQKEKYEVDSDNYIEFETIDGIRSVSNITGTLLYETIEGQILDKDNNIYAYLTEGYDYGDDYTYDYNTRQLIHKETNKVVNDYSFNTNLVYSLANKKEQIIKEEKIVKNIVEDGFDPFWNDLYLDSNLLYGDITIENERDIILFYRRLGLISDELGPNYKTDIDGKSELTPNWAIARAKIIDTLKAVWSNYAQHTWFNEYDDLEALDKGLISESTINDLKNMDKRYGSNLGSTDTLDKISKDPWLPLDYSLVNLPNWANHTVAVHPFVWALVEKTYNLYLDTLYITMYDSAVLNKIYSNVPSYNLSTNEFSKITDRPDETTDLIAEHGGYYINDKCNKLFNVNNWLYYNRDFSGYASKYQTSLNEDSRNSTISRFFDFDGPFNFEALMEVIESASDNLPTPDPNNPDTNIEELKEIDIKSEAEYKVSNSPNSDITSKYNVLREFIWDIIKDYYKYYQDCDI